jgi:ubiquinone/menaquinone biosynthesis C-methylase UbiE
MGIYAKYILPRLIDTAMRSYKDAARLRTVWIPRARGNVVEVGIGSGLNLEFYPPEVTSVCGVEPSVELQQMARRRAGSGARKIEFVTQSAEQTLPLDDASMDTVVSTWTLCSIPNAPLALGQMRRVLKPQGRLIFVEHGRSPDSGVAAWQDRLTPAWKLIGGGCHLNRKIDELIAGAGFRILEIEKSYLPGPRPMAFTYQGCAARD